MVGVRVGIGWGSNLYFRMRTILTSCKILKWQVGASSSMVFLEVYVPHLSFWILGGIYLGFSLITTLNFESDLIFRDRVSIYLFYLTTPLNVFYETLYLNYICHFKKISNVRCINIKCVFTILMILFFFIYFNILFWSRSHVFLIL